jgi:hypothetical protein
MASEVFFYPSTVPRKPSSLGPLSIFDTTPIGGFLELLGEFTAAYNIKKLISRYQSIDMHCIVLPAKCDAGLAISVHIFNSSDFLIFKSRRFEEIGGVEIKSFNTFDFFRNFTTCGCKFL